MQLCRNRTAVDLWVYDKTISKIPWAEINCCIHASFSPHCDPPGCSLRLCRRASSPQPWPWEQPSTFYHWPDGPILAATEKHQLWGLGPKIPTSHITAELHWFSSFLLIKPLWLLSQQHKGHGGENMSTSGLAAGCSAWSWVLAPQCPQGSGGTGATIKPSPIHSDD